MASEMVERVARAIYDTNNHWDHDDLLPVYSELTEGFKAQWQEAARAAIEAMREPTDAMVLVGASYHHDNWRRDHAREDTSAEAIWQDMTDAALAE